VLLYQNQRNALPDLVLITIVGNGTRFQLEKKEYFCFPSGVFKILRITEESQTLLYFKKKNPGQETESAT
jgi:hypothetical protein